MRIGMYDEIQGEIKCVNCGKEFVAEEQIKWADCMLRLYKVGDSIPAKDGEYDYGSFMRPKLIDQCPHCRTWQHFKAIVMNGALEKLESTTPFIEEELEQINEEFR